MVKVNGTELDIAGKTLTENQHRKCKISFA